MTAMHRERRDGIALQYNAPVTLTFALLSLLAIALGELTDGWTTQNLFCFFKTSTKDIMLWPRAILHVLGNTDLTTCTGNLIVLLVVGPAAEERFGSAKVLFAVLLTAAAGALIAWFLFPKATIMGASGVLFMMMVLASFACAHHGAIPITLLLVLALFLGSEVLRAVTGSAGLSELTHIAGGGVGILLGLLFNRKRAAAA
jgi:membrane associated rhomboid family serine protease